MKDHVEYPVNFPLECAIALSNAFRSGTLTSDLPTTALHLWNLQGYLQRAVIGVPQASDFFGHHCILPNVRQLSDFEKDLPKIIKECEAAAAPTSGEGLSAAAPAIDPATILMIVTIAKEVLALLKAWRNR